MGRYLKLKFNIGKCNILQIASKNIKMEYKLSNKEIKKVNEEYVHNDTKKKADSHILHRGQMKWLAGGLRNLSEET